mgnify:CR=1 FL=1
MIYEYWLAGIEGISNLKKRKLREGNGKAIYYIEETNLKKHTFLNEKDIERLKKAKKTVNLEMQWEKSVKKKIKFVPYFSDDYPKKMKVITDPPYALYVLGSLPDENVKSAAIVGARNCTSYGEQMALQYGKCLGHAGVQVISGMARGIDGAGQRGALNGDGTTFAVLGCGVDVCYPRENIGLYMDIQKKGGIISEFPPGTEPLARNFPMRNRIISGLAEWILVYRGKRKERIFDHCRFCTGSGEGCLCTSGTGDKCVEPGMSQTDPAGSGNTDHTGRTDG